MTSDRRTRNEANGDVPLRSRGKASVSGSGAVGGGKAKRRTHSFGRITDFQEKQKRERAEQSDDPCHEPKDSLLTSSSGYTNYRGLLNLCIVLLILSNARVALENIIKYGILVDPLQWIFFLANPTILPSVQILLGMHVFILISFFHERYLLSTGILSETAGTVLTTLNLSSIILIPAYTVFVTDCHVVASSIALGIVTMVWLKLVSYHMVNYWCRRDIRKRLHHYHNSPYNYNIRRHRSSSQNDRIVSQHVKEKMSTSFFNEDIDVKVYYPDNLNLKDIFYFMFAPTICYELNFPRSQRIRKRFLIRRFLEMIFLFQLILGLIQQWLVPTINNSLKPLQEMNYLKMCERLLKLAVPNHIIWLLFFYWFFHSSLNFIGELLLFADREFYRDWWNAESVHYFWQNWNIPVHRWCLRHLYKPLLRRGYSKCQASTAVFFVSAFFHEYLVSVPLKMFRIWAFSGMLFQIPFAMLVSKLHNYPHYANVAVWVSLIIGQPLCILMYYHDYYIIHQTN
ncbi:diacylglycerol O-acyltransferase 1-like protein [Dinothrombium tinctorium]|uniref:O-acyltransferase n=1 Tax=Dinothrombium tinctorium TaxID=1965070 RepID=A0A3S3NZ44_9ACAR|nr:diacylglycerol O-acyltransferase 1-like protein [Dinothrombium tinctorium]